MLTDKTHITIHDIARELNVSASTVSRALQNHPRISKTTREAVQLLAAKYNYQPNAVAASLRTGQGKTVGVIVPRINRNFFSNVIGGMEEVLSSAGYNLMICQTHEKYKNEKAAVQTLMNARVSTIIMSLSMETKSYAHLKQLKKKGIRLLFFDRISEEIASSHVVINDEAGAMMVVRHLIEQGYRKIVHVGGADHVTIYRARKNGYVKAMEEAGIRVKPGWIMEENMILEGGQAAFKKAFEQPVKPDAFFCAGDFAALGVLVAAREKGLNIPDDLGISGFGNEPLTEYLEPSMTTVHQRGNMMGKQVAKMFLSEVNVPKNKTKMQEEVLEPELIVRKSTVRNIN